MQLPKYSMTRTLLDKVVFAYNVNKLAGLPIITLNRAPSGFVNVVHIYVLLPDDLKEADTGNRMLYFILAQEQTNNK